tara:strand:- start:6542 stop:7183 length:642 start_codon:yes stop_codon:yes gene_type:complete
MKNALFLIFLLTTIFISFSLLANSTTQTNTSGSNSATSISGNYTSSTEYQSGSSNTTNNTTNSTSNTTPKANPVGSAIAPSMGSINKCSMAVSGSVSSTFVGVAAAKHYEDRTCALLSKAQMLYTFGLKVGALSVLCLEETGEIFKALWYANNVCPINGKLGEDAKKMWLKYPELIPNSAEFLKEIEYQASIDIQVIQKNNDPFIPIQPTIHK